MERRTVSSGGPWEAVVGYSRAVRVGPFVAVSGCTAMTPNGVVGGADVYAQAVQALTTVRAALEAAGAGLGDVIRTRVYVTDISEWEAVGRAHGEFFGRVRPATTMVEVSRLIDPVLRVEVEADAIISAGDPG